jgi:DNA-directed RNA polymerase subunit M/transcription elongation factor TFIIS
MRSDIVSLLNDFYKKSESQDIENKVYSLVFPDEEQTDPLLRKYQLIFYNIVSISRKYKDARKDLKATIMKAKDLKDLENAMYMTHRQLAENQRMRDEYITSPVDVEEGVMQCTKCGSMKTFSSQKQVRSGDEGFSTFCACVNCGAKWRIN